MSVLALGVLSTAASLAMANLLTLDLARIARDDPATRSGLRRVSSYWISARVMP